MILNLIFHQIFESESEIKDQFDASTKFLWQLIQAIQHLKDSGQSNFDDFRIYFDDGHDSFQRLVYPLLTPELKQKTTLAIVTDWIETPGFLTWQDLTMYQINGITIASHGTSHAALAVYKSGQLQTKVPTNGVYQNSPFGQGDILNQPQILYQYAESKKALKQHGLNIKEFVYPYGLYNDTAVRLNFHYGSYSTLSTCDELLDTGQPLRPRFLIDRQYNLNQTLNRIQQLKPLSTPSATV